MGWVLGEPSKIRVKRQRFLEGMSAVWHFHPMNPKLLLLLVLALSANSFADAAVVTGALFQWRSKERWRAHPGKRA
jgi:hypothetical protein